jgi:hypothetical protein
LTRRFESFSSPLNTRDERETKEGVRIKKQTFITIPEKLSGLELEKHLSTRAARGSRQAFLEALKAAPGIEPVNPDDRLDHERK